MVEINVVFKLTKLFTFVVISSALFGCYNKGELKTNIQNEYDSIPKCFFFHYNHMLQQKNNES